MKNKLLSCVAAAAIVLASANAMAGDHGKMKHDGANKPVSKVSEVQNMADDSMVYVQGYIIQNLGNDNYMLQDGSGQIMVEIDDDLIDFPIFEDYSFPADSPVINFWMQFEYDVLYSEPELNNEILLDELKNTSDYHWVEQNSLAWITSSL